MPGLLVMSTDYEYAIEAYSCQNLWLQVLLQISTNNAVDWKSVFEVRKHFRNAQRSQKALAKRFPDFWIVGYYYYVVQ